MLNGRHGEVDETPDECVMSRLVSGERRIGVVPAVAAAILRPPSTATAQSLVDLLPYPKYQLYRAI